MLERLALCEERADSHDTLVTSFISSVTPAHVLRHTILMVQERQKNDGRTFKSPEKNTRMILAKVRKEVAQLMSEIHAETGDDAAYDEDSSLDEGQSIDEASARRHLIEAQIEWKLNGFDVSTAEAPDLTATARRELIERRLEMRLDMAFAQESDSFDSEMVADQPPSPRYSDIISAIHKIDDQKGTQRDLGAWKDFKDIMFTVNKIQKIGQLDTSPRSIFAVDV